MTFTINDIIEEVYKKHKGKFPNISEEEFRLAAKTPINFIHKQMRSDTFPIIKIKYIGTLFAPPSKIMDEIGRVYMLKKKGYYEHTFEAVTKKLWNIYNKLSIHSFFNRKDKVIEVYEDEQIVETIEK